MIAEMMVIFANESLDTEIAPPFGQVMLADFDEVPLPDGNTDEAPPDPIVSDLVKRIEKLEKEGENLEDDLKKKFVVPGTSNSTVKLGGRIHLDYWAFPGDDAGVRAFEGEDPQDRYEFRRIRPFVSGTIGKNMIYKIDMEFADPNNFEFRDLFFGFEDLPVFQTLIIGNQKRPRGLDHWNSSRNNVFLERPFVIEAFNEDSRRLGIESYGVSHDQCWNWQYGLFNLERLQDDGTYLGDNYQVEVVGRLANTYWWANEGRCFAHWAISGSIAEPDGNGSPDHFNEARFRTRPEARSTARWLNTGRIEGTEHYELLGLEKLVNLGPLQLVGEVQQIWLQRAPGDDPYFWGGYVYAAYMLTGENMTWDRETGQLGRLKPFHDFLYEKQGCRYCKKGCGAWQVAARYSYLDITDGDIRGGVGNSLTLAVNWFWNANARLQFNYSRGWIDDHSPVDGQTSGQYDIIGVRAGVDF